MRTTFAHFFVVFGTVCLRVEAEYVLGALFFALFSHLFRRNFSPAADFLGLPNRLCGTPKSRPKRTVLVNVAPVTVVVNDYPSYVANATGA